MSIRTALSLSRRPMAAFVVLGSFWGTFAAHVPVFKATLGVNDAVFGTLLLGSACGLVSSMWIAPRLDRRLAARGMPVAVTAFAALFLLIPLAPTPALFAAALLVVGTASGLLDVVMNSRVSDLEARSGRSLMNANHAMFSAGYAAGALLSGATREAGLSPIWLLCTMAVLAMSVAPSLRMAPSVVAPGAADHAARYPLWPILLCGAVVFVAFAAEATVEQWSALHVERTLGGGAAEGALGPAMLGITMTIGRFSGQVVAERLSELRVVVLASLVSAAGAVIAAIAPSPLVAYVGFGTLGLGVSVIGPMGLALVGKLVAPHLRTEAISRAAVMGFSGFFFAPVLMGLMSQAFGLRMAFVSVAVLLLCALPLAAALVRFPPRSVRVAA